ncbi:hypothetical protein ACFWWA_38760 [Streptomyces goshikiensis]|uniref:hypothetical protein n=1 Tax=Streptomyces goshikiensis TaxID=1942 RepID=UPI00365ED106
MVAAVREPGGQQPGRWVQAQRAAGQVYPVTLEADKAGETVLRWAIPPYDFDDATPRVSVTWVPRVLSRVVGGVVAGEGILVGWR